MTFRSRSRSLSRRQFLTAQAAAIGGGLLMPRRGRAVESRLEFFDGIDGAGREVMDQARRDIERIRKGDFKLRVVDAAGKPIAGQVRLRHVRHEFRFGGPFSENPLFLDLFNAGRMNPHWGDIQKAEDGPDGPYQWDRFDKKLNAAHVARHFDALALPDLRRTWLTTVDRCQIQRAAVVEERAGDRGSSGGN